jgi:hypothetical protein
MCQLLQHVHICKGVIRSMVAVQLQSTESWLPPWEILTLRRYNTYQ